MRSVRTRARRDQTDETFVATMRSAEVGHSIQEERIGCTTSLSTMRNTMKTRSRR